MRLRRLWLWLGAALLLVGVLFWGAARINARHAQAAFEEQLRLARTEGLPTNADEFARTIRTVAPAANAAPFYQRLAGLARKGDPVQVTLELIFRRDAKSRSDAENMLRENGKFLTIVDQAVRRPGCYFRRDWSKGPAVVLREYADMKKAARYLALRGALSVDRNDPASALADIGGMFRIADHAAAEQLRISELVSLSIRVMACKALAYWAFVHRDNPAYRLALGKAIDRIPRPDIRWISRDELFMTLWLLDRSTTAEGRKEIGLRDGDFPGAYGIITLFMNQPKARVDVVKAERRWWRAFALTRKDRDRVQGEAEAQLSSVLRAFPIAAYLHDQMGTITGSTAVPQDLAEADRVRLRAVLRVVDGPRTPARIKTSDLISPWDGLPVRYSFDGLQTVISAGKGPDLDTDPTLKIPPDKELPLIPKRK